MKRFAWFNVFAKSYKLLFAALFLFVILGFTFELIELFILAGLITLTIVLMSLVFVMFLIGGALAPNNGVDSKKRRLTALKQYVAKAGGSEIFVKRVGVIGTYQEHYLVNYRDSENQWQVRHVIRNQLKERFYWDDPIVAYEREVSAEISQSKQQLINDLELEIQQLQRAIVIAEHKEKVV